MIDWSQMIGAEARAAEALAEAKAAARAALTHAIDQARRQLVTDLPGQQMIYLAKEAEARAWLAEPQPDLAAYPLLSAETGLTAPDPDTLAQIWLNLAAIWRQEAARLEALRLATAAAIETARTPEAVQAALTGSGLAP